MALRFKLQLVVVADDDQQVCVDDLIVLDKDHERPEHLGLTLAEAKEGMTKRGRSGGEQASSAG